MPRLFLKAHDEELMRKQRQQQGESSSSSASALAGGAAATAAASVEPKGDKKDVDDNDDDDDDEVLLLSNEEVEAMRAAVAAKANLDTVKKDNVNDTSKSICGAGTATNSDCEIIVLADDIGETAGKEEEGDVTVHDTENSDAEVHSDISSVNDDDNNDEKRAGATSNICDTSFRKANGKAVSRRSSSRAKTGAKATTKSSGVL